MIKNVFCSGWGFLLRTYSAERQASHRIDEYIEGPDIILINEKGVNVGRASLSLTLAGLDRKIHELKQVAVRDSLPLCKIFSKRRDTLLEVQKNASIDTKQEMVGKRGLGMVSGYGFKKTLKVTRSKIMEMNTVITDHDFQHKYQRIERFLMRGYRVNVELSLKPPSTEQDMRTLYERIRIKTSTLGTIVAPKLSSNRIIFIIDPKSDAVV